FDKFLDVANVDTAPNAAGPARREANLVALFIDRFSKAVDPAEAKSFIDRLGPGDAGLAGILFVEANPEFFRSRMISCEPFAESCGGFEEFEGHSKSSGGSNSIAREVWLRRSLRQERNVYSTGS